MLEFPSEKRLPFDGIRTNSVYKRNNLVTIKNMAHPYEDSLKDWLMSSDDETKFRHLVDQIISFRAQGKPVVWSMGAHVIKNGLSRYIIEMIRHGILTHVSGNGATSIHDFELAFLGGTSEDVARAIEDGSFGMWEETGRYMNVAIQEGSTEGLGYGESLYRYLKKNPERFPYSNDCVFAQCHRLGIPYTCHISIGTDIIHQHPIVDFEALGKTSGRDFKTMVQSIAGLDEGGVYLNFGSAISGPEIFLKGLSMARNSGRKMSNIVAANFDILSAFENEIPTENDPNYYYRPRRNFVELMNQVGGTGYLFQGMHQETIPRLFHYILARKRELKVEFLPYKRKNQKINSQLYPIKERKSNFHINKMLKLETQKVLSWNPPEFKELIQQIKQARAQKKEILVSLGGNVIGRGLNRYLIDLIKNGFITHVAVNGASAFQDFELAAFGHTEESVNGTLANGTLGMWKEPGDYLHEALMQGNASGLGYGDSLMAYTNRYPDRFPYLNESLMGIFQKYRIPYTVHITLGTDAVQQHPSADFAVQGNASGLDFKSYCHTVSKLEDGVFLNFGSTVTGPEVFLKALSITRNLGFPIHHITTANFDIVKLGDYHRTVGYEDWDYYYRPRKNIIHRPTSLGGRGFHFEGQHQYTIPSLWNELQKDNL